ncbi:hypothetical protein BCR32DRAFT_287389 [Anaeromyces robustus]|uniref:MCM AAA-lid domain-containing protein n=1 Tax=Anaeromyces robustus TaxID=1754192 RepID=A0A1Y1VRW2_9FUNG|nr:hypothetical protein BCR32DRAFT_287389 [Anaeromyces robustus]|eukprot:ORX64021.1 hypothetical protein BCR32DRAFT_287389 [Anaeromyces robustus]
MNEELFVKETKKRNKLEENIQTTSDNDTINYTDIWELNYNIEHNTFSQELPSLFSETEDENENDENDQDKTIVPDQSLNNSVTTKRSHYKVINNNKNKKQKISTNNKDIDSENENENENENEINKENDENEIEVTSSSPINNTSYITISESQKINENNQKEDNNHIFNNFKKRYKRDDYLYTLYDSDDEEDKSLLEKIFKSDKYEKIKNYLSSYHMVDILNAIEKKDTKKKFNDHNSHQFYIVYLIDIYHITNYDMEIGNDIIQGFKNDIKKYFECATLSLLESHLFKENINLINLKKKLSMNIRFKNIPSTDISIISNLKNTLNKCFFHNFSIIHEDTFYNIKGIITALYLPEYFVQYHTFICENPLCKRYKERKILHQNYNYSFTSNGIEVQPNVVDKNFINNNICTYCKRQRSEIIEERIGTLIQKGMLTVLEKNGCYFNTCTIFIEGEDLINSIFIGDIVNIIGILERQKNSTTKGKPKLFYNDYYIKVNNMWSCSFVIETYHKLYIETLLINTLKTNQELVEHHINQSYIPKSISFFLKLNLSSFAFTQRLIDCFCEDIVPSSMLRKTKLMILLSLVSTPSDPKSSFHYLIEWEKNSFEATNEKIHLMFVMDDYYPLFLRLIESSQKMRRNHNLVMEDNKYKPLINISSTTDKHIKSPSFIDGGNLCYAKDGILKIPFSNLTPKEIKHVISVMDTQVNIPLQGSQIECLVPFINTTIVWGLYDLQYLNIKNKKGKNNIKYIKDSITNNTDLFSQMFNSFNLYSYMKVKPDKKYDKLFCEDLIESMCVMEKENDDNDNDDNEQENIKIPDINREDFIFYINTVSNIDVEISNECNKLLKDYCHIYRKKINLTIEISSTVYILQKLINIAMCHSRLCFRNIATIDDALVAIIIFEESVATLEKNSTLLIFKSLPNDMDNFSNFGSLTLEERISCYKNRKKNLAEFNKIVKNDDEIIGKVYEKLNEIFTNN